MTVRDKLKNLLRINGYRCSDDESFWEKSRDRREKRIRINKGSFEVTNIEHPVFREGWTKHRYRLTHKNVDNFNVWV